MGLAVSVLVPSGILSTGICLLQKGTYFYLGSLVPFAFEAGHVITNGALYCEGERVAESSVLDAAQWKIFQFGIRSYSLNCCGRWNHAIDIVRRCLAPLSSTFSGRMIHDVVVVFIENPTTKEKAFVFHSKTHSGDLYIRFCRDLKEVDDKAKPVVFGRPKRGWWKALVPSHGLQVQDLLNECASIPTEYQPVSNNCHHFSKDLWNWHLGQIDDKEKWKRFMHLPRGRCRRKPSRHFLRSPLKTGKT